MDVPNLEMLRAFLTEKEARCVLEEIKALRTRVALLEAVAANRPKIICFCGSSRFIAKMAVLMWNYEKAGHIALGLHLLPANYPGVRPDHQGEAEGVAAAMDELHLRKIDMADEVFVVNVSGYIGESTRAEIDYAERIGKPVMYLEVVTEREASDAEG